MGIDMRFEAAFAKAQLGAGVRLPRAGTVFRVTQRVRQAANDLNRAGI